MSYEHGFRVSLLAAVCGVALATGVRSAGAAETDDTNFSPAITIAEIMDSMVMPTAQVLWDAVGVQVTEQGQIETKPETDEQWAQLRAAVVTLAEATNSLVVPGRHAAPPGTISANPDSDLSPEKIDAMIAAQRPAWVAHAQVLRAATMQALAAVDARNIEAISEIGGNVDEACESCHLQFWYPEQR